MEVFISINTYVLEQEKPEMDDFERKQNIGSRGKLVLTDTLAKDHKIFLYILLFQNIPSTF